MDDPVEPASPLAPPTPLQQREQQGSLLIASLLEHVCNMYESSPERSQQLLKTLLRRLVKLKAIPEISLVDTANIRAAYRNGFQVLLQDAKQALAEGYSEDESEHSRAAGGLDLALISSPFASLPPPPPAACTLDSLLKQSRYATEFEEVAHLGSGGFGAVYRARHRLDHKEYAVKKIQMRRDVVADSFLREVRTLASLDHPHIVRYHAAWLEERPDRPACGRLALPPGESFVEEEGQGEEEETDDEEEETDEGDSATGTASQTGGATEPLASSSDNTTTFADDSAPRPEPAPSTTSKRLVARRLMPRPYTLYIQMALCEHSLHQWLRRYWAQPTACPTQLDATDYREALRMCLEITEGVNHLHSLNLIHRDLKPSNVFLQRRAGETQWRVAIGDFGLARALPIANLANDSDSGVPCSAVSMAITPATAAASCTMSSGVGTETYASPEQISGGVYDTKTDIYSLGLIFFEMLSSFATEMERLMQLRELKDGVLPADFIARYPREAAFILCMTAKKPQDRPTARSLLEGDGALFAVAAAKRDALEAEQQQRAQDLRILQEQIREQEARFALLNKMLQGYTMNNIDPNLLGEG